MRRLIARYALLCAMVLVINFVLPRLLPGDPFEPVATAEVGATAPLSAAARAQLRASYHLDESLNRQFVLYVADLSRGDLGWSIARSAPVAQLIGERLPWTLALVASATAIAAVVGVLVGITATWLGGAVDHTSLMLAATVAALPEFLIAMGLLLLFGVTLGWFPLQGGRSPLGGDALDVAWHLSLPALALFVASLASFLVVTRGALRSQLRQPYLLTARAKGLTEQQIAVRHLAPNALTPIATQLAVRLGHVLGGALVIERVFSIPGLGLLAFESIRTRDIPVLQAIFLIGSLGVLAANFLLDALLRGRGRGRA
jgi:peptide/nickel transport system permease protein